MLFIIFSVLIFIPAVALVESDCKEPNGECGWYEKCLAEKAKCESAKNVLQMAGKQCQLSVNSKSEEVKMWLHLWQVCAQRRLAEYLNKEDASCEDTKATWLKISASCLINPKKNINPCDLSVELKEKVLEANEENLDELEKSDPGKVEEVRKCLKKKPVDCAPDGDCGWYGRCLEKYFPCGVNGFALKYAQKHCDAAASGKYSEMGKLWVKLSEKCAQKKITSLFSRNGITCEKIQEIGITAAMQCLVDPLSDGGSPCKIIPDEDKVKVRTASEELLKQLEVISPKDAETVENCLKTKTPTKPAPVADTPVNCSKPAAGCEWYDECFAKQSPCPSSEYVSMEGSFCERLTNLNEKLFFYEDFKKWADAEKSCVGPKVAKLIEDKDLTCKQFDEEMKAIHSQCFNDPTGTGAPKFSDQFFQMKIRFYIDQKTMIKKFLSYEQITEYFFS